MQYWTTLDKPVTDQFSYWREVLCAAFTELDPRAGSGGPFESTVRLKQISDLTVSDVSSKKQFVRRGPHEIRRSKEDYFFANLQLSGDCLVRQDGREARIHPGDFYLVDTTRPYDLIFSDWRILCLRIPWHQLAPLLKSPRRVTAIRFGHDGGIGTITTSYLRSLIGCSETVDPRAQLVLASNLCQLLTIAAGTNDAAVNESGRTAVRSGLQHAIDEYIKVNAGNPYCSIHTAAKYFNISTRSIYKLFEDRDTSFNQSLVNCRLDKCAEELCLDKTNSYSISEIAYRWGFNDLSNFCRVFRKRFGMSAKQYRSQTTE